MVKTANITPTQTIHYPEVTVLSENGNNDNKSVCAKKTGVTKFLNATRTGISNKLRLGFRPARKNKTVPAESLRLAMRDTRSYAAQALADEDMQDVITHSKQLLSQSLSALRKGDAALCNGGLMSLCEIGVELIKIDEAGISKKLAQQLVKAGVHALEKHETGTTETARTTLELMRNEAQRSGNTSYADALFRSQLTVTDTHGRKLAESFITDGDTAISQNDLKGLKKVLENIKALVRSAGSKEKTESTIIATHTLEALISSALQQKDEPLANTIALHFTDVIRSAGTQNDCAGLVQATLGINRAAARAASADSPHTEALLRSFNSQITEAAGKLSGGMSEYLTAFPISTEELSTVAEETCSLALAASQNKNKTLAVQHITSLNEIANTLIARGEAKRVLPIATGMAEIGQCAAEKAQLSVLDTITDALAFLTDTCIQKDEKIIGIMIESQQLKFDSAWRVALTRTVAQSPS
ncbi:hypothetical protein [Halodesulfovibrio spirochaetisodalis]|uniref:Uncharacterized protein n=1 Tax=Halodesulfovibrio spirochaetisodalis TaxID=1560234 RepID=A0A1B7XBD7_9BACT|nr:hypothetical protein [Halodesulfovibrio spirochaetisodalis]OBQ46689.1 hypothetical protein SP90_11235 [Halodesulfovibrio spirochaetisodalis]